jgi:NAD(P)-dependent dehydrogenase (short-subunit alcohol dehydrogenase family)
MIKRVAMVTGGARGIGRAIAEQLCRGGLDVAILDLPAKRPAEIAAEIAAQGAGRAIGTACDVTDQAQVDSAVAAVRQDLGSIDVLVNNAGICPGRDVMEMDVATFRHTLDVNLVGAFLVTQAAARAMIAQGRGGRVVFITSLAVNVTAPSQADYAASKAGLHMLMRAFAVALAGHRITCNAVAPGVVDTPMAAGWWQTPGGKGFLQRRVPMKREAKPDDIAQAVELLASPGCDYMTGTSLTVDGGLTAYAGE